jgi:uncharacterized protein (DUF1015 family)
VAELNPFGGIRYSNTGELKDLVCPPYDVITPEEQARLYARHPHNAVRVELPFSEHPEEAKEERYRRAARHFQQWLDEEVLIKDTSPTYYVYRQDFVAPGGARKQVTGVIGALHLERIGPSSGILPHERTMPGPVEDRLALLRACPVNISPIYGIYRGGGGLMPYLDSLENRPPAARFADEHGHLHRLWTVTAPAELEVLGSALRAGPLVIADGHHRYETALAYYKEQNGAGGHQAVMCFCVDADAEDLEVLPYHRAFLTDVDPDEIERRLEEQFEVKSELTDARTALQESKADHPMVFVLPERDLLVEVSAEAVSEVVGERAEAWRSLDVVALHEVVFKEALAEGIDNIFFSHDAAEVVALVREQGWSGGVLLRPLKAPEIIEVAKSGERMPQKASYFWPKAVTGLVFRSLR